MDKGEVGLAVLVARVKLQRLAKVFLGEKLVVFLFSVKPGRGVSVQKVGDACKIQKERFLLDS